MNAPQNDRAQSSGVSVEARATFILGRAVACSDSSGPPHGVPTREEVIDGLRVVEDPELGMDIVELGLLYDAQVEGSKVHVTFSLTSMGCPVGPMIEQQIHETVASMPGVEEVEAELTWDPPWTPERMSDDASSSSASASAAWSRKVHEVARRHARRRGCPACLPPY